VADNVVPDLVTLAHDPQTSGGLLVAVPGSRVVETLDALLVAGVEAWHIGQVQDGGGVALT
jgi:selenophosphate synthase